MKPLDSLFDPPDARSRAVRRRLTASRTQGDYERATPTSAIHRRTPAGSTSRARSGAVPINALAVHLGSLTIAGRR